MMMKHSSTATDLQGNTPSDVPDTTNIAEKEDDNYKNSHFAVLSWLVHLIGVVMLILVVIWIQSYRGGLQMEFPWHILIMTVSMVYILPNGMLVYHTASSLQKSNQKLLHAGINFTTLVLMVVGIAIVFHNNYTSSDPDSNLYTMHSWVGLIAATIYFIQWLCGFLMFLYPGGTISARKIVHPNHIYVGVLVFICAVATSLLGLMEEVMWHIRQYDLAGLCSQAVLVNVIAIVHIAFAGLVVYLVTSSKFKQYKNRC